MQPAKFCLVSKCNPVKFGSVLILFFIEFGFVLFLFFLKLSAETVLRFVEVMRNGCSNKVCGYKKEGSSAAQNSKHLIPKLPKEISYAHTSAFVGNKVAGSSLSLYAEGKYCAWCDGSSKSCLGMGSKMAYCSISSLKCLRPNLLKPL